MFIVCVFSEKTEFISQLRIDARVSATIKTYGYAQCSTGNGFLTGTGNGNGNGKKCRERE